MTPSDRLDLLELYAERGWTLLRLNGKTPCDENGELLLGWDKCSHAPSDVRPPWNVGIRLGAPSRGLVDVDLDCQEALDLAPLFLPTASTFGRASKPRAHWLYTVQEPGPIERIPDVRKPGAKDGETLLELRGTGGQTMFPPSIHPDGEHVEWTADPDEPEHPPTVDLGELRERFHALGAACFVARYAGTEAGRAFAEHGTFPELPALVRLRVAELLGVVPERRVPVPTAPRVQTASSGWIDALNARGVAALATALALEEQRNGSWAPCPACTAEKRGSKEHRGAIGLRRDGHGWACHACKTKGDAVALAAWVLLGRRPVAGDPGWRDLRVALEVRGLL